MHKYSDINESGHSIRCKIYATDLKNIQKVVLFGHGFGGHKDNKAAEKFADKLLSKHKEYAVVTFNWPCHGDDASSRLSLTLCDQYIQTIADYLKSQYDTEELYCYATSFGGYLFLKYISEHGNPFRKIALRCPAINMYRVITESIIQSGDMDKIKKGKAVLIGFDRKIKVEKSFFDELEEADLSKRDFIDYADSILILHGPKDEVVPFQDAASFAEENIIEMIPVEKADHRFQDPKAMDQAIHSIIQFFAE